MERTIHHQEVEISCIFEAAFQFGKERIPGQFLQYMLLRVHSEAIVFLEALLLDSLHNQSLAADSILHQDHDAARPVSEKLNLPEVLRTEYTTRRVV